jgi:toxin ParE1/3/4
LYIQNRQFKAIEESLDFVAENISPEKLIEIRNQILDAADTLIIQPFKGQKEPYLEHLGLDHRRLIQSHYKIIYMGDYSHHKKPTIENSL